MIRKITNAVLGKNYVATALLYTGLTLVIFAITPSQEGITSAGEEDSFGLFCLVCGSEKVTFTSVGQAADVEINGVEMHGTWTIEVKGHTCQLKFFTSSNQGCVKLPVRSIFKQNDNSWTWSVTLPNVYQCNYQE